mmetsp:Transcript_51565/g.131118  ORF Transcript_51565/g.131118 Transcript_51565/m.131118 type:complete len:362 (-) Transcript_51565:355-1440(-)
MVVQWERHISSHELTFDDDRTVRRLGDSGCMPRALISAESLTGFRVSVVSYPGSMNTLSIGAEYSAEVQGTVPSKFCLFGGMRSCGLRSCGLHAEVWMNNKCVTAAPLPKDGDVVLFDWDEQGAVRLSVSGGWFWTGQLQVPRGHRAFFGVSLASDNVLRLHSVCKPQGRPAESRYSEKLLNSIAFSDVKLACLGGEALDAHRCMLAAASPVFETMLRSGMREATELRVEIRASKPVVADFLRHIYTGEFDEHIQAAPMLELAHFYELSDYAAFCGELLVKNLAPATISETTRAISRLRSLVASRARSKLSQDANVFDDLWCKLSERVESDPQLVRALLESHAGVPIDPLGAGSAGSVQHG